MSKRKIIKIDQEKCNGCGECVPNCAEGAIKIIFQKAHLVSDIYCDGLGACLGHCPMNAISIEEREAEDFDEEATRAYLKSEKNKQNCPSAKVEELKKSPLNQWPIQLALVPPTAPFLNNSDLLIAADCVPFAYPNFHSDFLRDKIVLIGCPKLDDAQQYQQKLNRLFRQNNINSITITHMEVPCCFGLVNIVEEAVKQAGKEIPLKEICISVTGEIK